MATVRKANSTQSKINMVLYGGHGAGKSTFALSSAYLKREDGKPFRVLYIDNENGSVDDYLDGLAENGINLDNILIVYTTSLVETKEFIRQAAAKEPFKDDDGNVITDADGQPFVADMIVVDGSTVLHKSAIQARREFSKKRATVRVNKKDDITAAERFVAIDGADIELKDYSAINFEGQSLVLDLTGCGLHYILTAREKEVMEKKVIKVNGVDKEISINTGVFEPEGFKGLEYNAKTVARLYRDDNDPTVKMYVSKDRTNTYEPHSVVEDPTIMAFQTMIEKNKGRQNFAPTNTMAGDIKIEMEKVEREVLGTTIAEAEVGKTATVDEALASGPSTEEQLQALNDEAKTIISTFTPAQKEELKAGLTAKGFKTVSRAAIKTVEEMTTYLEVVKSIKDK